MFKWHVVRQSNQPFNAHFIKSTTTHVSTTLISDTKKLLYLMSAQQCTVFIQEGDAMVAGYLKCAINFYIPG